MKNLPIIKPVPAAFRPDIARLNAVERFVGQRIPSREREKNDPSLELRVNPYRMGTTNG